MRPMPAYEQASAAGPIRESRPMMRMPSTGLGMGVAAPYEDPVPSISSNAPAVPQRRNLDSEVRSTASSGAASIGPGGNGRESGPEPTPFTARSVAIDAV